MLRTSTRETCADHKQGHHASRSDFARKTAHEAQLRSRRPSLDCRHNRAPFRRPNSNTGTSVDIARRQQATLTLVLSNRRSSPSRKRIHPKARSGHASLSQSHRITTLCDPSTRALATSQELGEQCCSLTGEKLDSTMNRSSDTRPTRSDWFMSIAMSEGSRSGTGIASVAAR